MNIEAQILMYVLVVLFLINIILMAVIHSIRLKGRADTIKELKKRLRALEGAGVSCIDLDTLNAIVDDVCFIEEE